MYGMVGYGMAWHGMVCMFTIVYASITDITMTYYNHEHQGLEWLNYQKLSKTGMLDPFPAHGPTPQKPWDCGR